MCFGKHEFPLSELPECNDEHGLFAYLGKNRVLLVEPDGATPGHSFITIAVGGLATGTVRPAPHRLVPGIACHMAQDAGCGDAMVQSLKKWKGLSNGENVWLRERRESSTARLTGGITYFIQAGHDGPIKIGTASDPESRIKTLQCGNHVPLRLLASFPDSGDTSEKKLHRRFAKHQIRGEWFAPHYDILKFVKEHK